MLGIFQDSKDIRLLINFREGSTEKNNDKTRDGGRKLIRDVEML